MSLKAGMLSSRCQRSLNARFSGLVLIKLFLFSCVLVSWPQQCKRY